jgi:putative Holliday junction resolvase
VRTGVRLGVDVGSVRVGVASCDPAGLIATPVETLRRGHGDLTALAQMVTERDAVEVVVGLPTSLTGRRGPAAAAVEAYAGELATLVGVPVRLVDERFSTVDAQRGLRDSGVDTRKGRSIIDQAAAVIILQGALDAERSSGAAPGRLAGPTGQIEGDGNRHGKGDRGVGTDLTGRTVRGER